jgi:hypothetical protein
MLRLYLNYIIRWDSKEQICICMIKVESGKEKIVLNRLLDMFVEDTKQKGNLQLSLS